MSPSPTPSTNVAQGNPRQAFGAGGVLPCMHIACLAITIMAALANGYAAFLNFAGAESVRVVADRVRVSQRWMIRLGPCWPQARSVY
jgi:hypothetical protein